MNGVDFDVAVAIPSIANEFSLTIKIGSNSQIYNTEKEISFVLNVLKICFEEASLSENTFWQAYGELKGINIKLSKENVKVFNLNSVVELFKTDNVIIKENPIEMQTILERKDDKWKFFLPLDGPDTVIEAVKTMILFKESISIDYKSCELVVGRSFDSDHYNSAPLLFLIKNSLIHLVVTDFIDTLILIDKLKNVKLDDVNFETTFNGLLSINSLNDTICEERAKYAIDLHNKLNFIHPINMKSFGKFPFESLTGNKNLIDAALNNIRAFVNKTKGLLRETSIK